MTDHNRQTYFDFLRAIAIMMVVGIHTMKGDFSDFTSLTSILNMIFRLIYNCAVPIFLAISGFFLAGKDLNTWQKIQPFLLKQIKAIYIPTLIFSIPCLLIDLYVSKCSNIALDIIYCIVCGYSVYYFIALIIQYYTISPILSGIINYKGIVVCCVLSLSSITAVTYFLKVAKIYLPLVIYAGLFPVWIAFFLLGMFLRKYNRNYNIALPLVITVTGLVCQLSEHKYWLDHGSQGLGIKVSSFIFSFGAILLLFAKRCENLYLKYLQSFKLDRIGTISFGIYLIHLYVMMVVDKFVTTDSWFVSWLITLVASIMVIELSKKIFPSFSRKYLGFR